MDLHGLDRLPKKQSAAFLRLLGYFQHASSAGTLYQENKKRPYPPNDEIARYIFETLLYVYDSASREEASLWPGWEE